MYTMTFWLLIMTAVFVGMTLSTMVTKYIEHKIHEARFRKLDAKFDICGSEREKLESLVKV